MTAAAATGAVETFTRSWAALRSAVAHLPDAAFARPSGCRGWLVQDLVCHLVIDAQDVLITLATPADGGAGGVGVEAAPVKDAVTYWTVTTQPPSGQDPLDALTVRLAAAYQDPELLRFHLDDVGSAAGRAAVLADPAARVSTQGAVLTVADYLSAYVLEWALHHLDLVADLPGTVDVPGPSADTLAAARELLERIAGEPFPAAWPDADALLVGTGRRVPTDTERAQLGPLADRVPLVLS
ncbi:maleylpyruvate isomerase N-terminal domain-containing protein [Prauserella rugosa]|uniref:Mycothiol maleylpyruvate isomerase-like protein n=1 Tax=Prauserella rugosa TaxID=43354 RepID=A0A660C794_9PSEU|nr:maleylpyruvate isomerase N-terminal domain-containing protein [Prauserella rugosa]KID31407.1 Mycothiol maleylpyruvate isomerase N-terminal domain [Prauserella sp. Am3]KMS90547.1 maleylpyruvate isomerase [Streptomyces regensis]TWH19216.1 mycothiol maleylpyruvate isomerase-like protein [Prauserella rugosa]